MKKDISVFSIMLFMVASPYLLFTYFYIPLLIQNNKNTAYLIPLIMIIISAILVIVLPKKISAINYCDLLNKSLIAKIIYVLFLLISTVINMFIVIRVVSELFFYEYHYILITGLVIVAILLLSRNKISNIINASTIVLITCFILGFIPYFLTSDVKDYSLLLPFENHSVIETIIYGSFFVLETISYSIFFFKTKTKFTKKKLFITLFFIFSFFVLEIMHIIVLAGTAYFNEMEFLGYLTFFIQDTITYVGNMGFIYLYILPVIGLLKTSFSLQTIKELLNIKDSILLDLILGLVFAIMVIFLFKVRIFSFIKIVVLLLTGLLSVIYIFITINRSEKYEITF